MPEARALIALLVDFANLRSEPEAAVEEAAPAKPARKKAAAKKKAKAAAKSAKNGAASNVAASKVAATASNGASTTEANGAAGDAAERSRDLAQALVRFAKGGGRLGLARAYADWTRDPEGARGLNGTRLEPVMVPATDDGEDRSHIRLVVDAMDVLYNGEDPDAFVIVSGDPTLVPLAQALRSDGAELVVVTAEGEAGELGAQADACLTIEDVLAGAELEPVRLRPAQAGRDEGRGGGSRDRGSRSARGRFEDRPVKLFDGGPGPEPDFSGYDWSPFIRLIDELEDRLPFVGVRYLVNKVLAPHNCSIEDPRLKRDLINEAVDEGIIELYTVGNVEDRLDPVTACRLDRKNGIVVAELGPESGPGADDDEGEDDFEPFDDMQTPARHYE